MLCLSGFELLSRWVPLNNCICETLFSIYKKARAFLSTNISICHINSHLNERIKVSLNIFLCEKLHNLRHLRQNPQVNAHIFLMLRRTSGFIDLQYPSSFSLGQRDGALSLQSCVSETKSKWLTGQVSSSFFFPKAFVPIASGRNICYF